MKKIFAALVLTVLAAFMFMPAIGLAGVFNGQNSAYVDTTLLSSNTDTTATAVKGTYIPTTSHTCTVVWSGITPTTSVVTFKYGIDSTNLVSLEAYTVSSSGSVTNFTTPVAQYIGISAVRSSSSPTSKTTVRCVSK